MKQFLASTAIVMFLAGSASAQMRSYEANQQDIEASDFIGTAVYATETLPAADAIADVGEKKWDNIGEVNDVILGRDGQIKAVVLGVGGFLGVGEKNVAVGMEGVRFVKGAEGGDDYFLVVSADKDALFDAPAYTPREARMPSEAAAVPEAPATVIATDIDLAKAVLTEGSRTPLVRPEVSRDGYSVADVAELTADKLQGARVYSATEEDVGEINRLVLDGSGQVSLVVLDIGGFLGVGERQIAVTLDELMITRSSDGDEVRVYVDANKAVLEAQPEYKG